MNEGLEHSFERRIPISVLLVFEVTVSALVLAINKVLTAPFFLKNLRNFETKRDTSEKHGMKSLDLLKIYQSELFYLISFSSK